MKKNPTLHIVELFAVCLLTLAQPSLAASEDLQGVLAKLDQSATKFRSAQANFTWTTFNTVVNDFSPKQRGKIYFERSGKETKMAAFLDPPDAEQVVFSGGKIDIYKPKLATEDVYDAGAHREEFETFLVLGFGSSGTEMSKSFDMKYEGAEKIEGVDTAKLELTPKAENMKNHFPQILLWIDPERGVSLQQKLMEPNGDYRLANYSNVRLGEKIPETKFKVKTVGRTTVINH